MSVMRPNTSGNGCISNNILRMKRGECCKIGFCSAPFCFFCAAVRQCGIIYLTPCSVSDGLLSPRRESNQGAAETSSVSAFPPLSNLALTLITDTPSKKTRCVCLAHPLDCRCCFSLPLLRCVWCAGSCFLLCTEVCFLLGQRQRLTGLVTDGLRADRRSVFRCF